MAHDIANLPDGQKFSIGVNEYSQPCSDKTSAKLSSWIGILARNNVYLPATYSDWRDVPQAYKDDAWIKIRVLTLFFT